MQRKGGDTRVENEMERRKSQKIKSTRRALKKKKKHKKGTKEEKKKRLVKRKSKRRTLKKKKQKVHLQQAIIKRRDLTEIKQNTKRYKIKGNSSSWTVEIYT